ncbi:MAG: hypothetical protein ABI056_04370 [Caulobacteraceae bacterium]
MSKSAFALAAGSLAAAVVGIAAASAQASEPASTHAPCFFVTQWQGWSSPRPDMIYLGVNLHEVYQVDLAGGGSNQLGWPNTHLVSIVRGGNSICSSLDLDLKIAENGGGFVEPLIATGLRKLTPDEVAAIPRKYLTH